MDIYSTLETKLDTELTSYITNTSSDLVNWLGPIFHNLLIIYIVLWGYSYWMGKLDEPFTEGLKRIFKITIILQVALVVGTYNAVIVKFFFDGPEQLAGVITSVTPSSTLLDSLYDKGFEIGDKAWEKAGVMSGNIGMYFVAFIIWLAVIVLTAYAAFLLMLAKVALSVLLGIGPLFICMILFQPTTRWFESWLSQVFNFGLVLVLAVAVVQIILGLFEDMMAALIGSGTVTTESMLAIVALSIISCFVLAQVTTIAASLAGGFGLTTMGAFGRGARAAGGGAARAGRGAYAGAKGLGNAYKNKFGGNSLRGN